MRPSGPILYLFMMSAQNGTSHEYMTPSTSILFLSFSSVKCLIVLICPCHIPMAPSIFPLLFDDLTGDSMGTVWPVRAAATARLRARMLGSWSDFMVIFSPSYPD